MWKQRRRWEYKRGRQSGRGKKGGRVGGGGKKKGGMEEEEEEGMEGGRGCLTAITLRCPSASWTRGMQGLGARGRGRGARGA